MNHSEVLSYEQRVALEDELTRCFVEAAQQAADPAGALKEAHGQVREKLINGMSMDEYMQQPDVLSHLNIAAHAFMLAREKVTGIRPY